MDSHNDVVQSFCWKGDGSLSATSSKVKLLQYQFADLYMYMQLVDLDL